MKIWIDIILVLVLLSPVWLDLVCGSLHFMKFRIIKKYSYWDNNYYYYIEQQCLWWWTTPEFEKRGIMGRGISKYSDCKSAEKSLDEWWLSQQPPEVILEKTFN